MLFDIFAYALNQKNSQQYNHIYSIEKLEIPSEGAIASYQLAIDGVTDGVKIDIPKDNVVSGGEIKTVIETNQPYEGAIPGEKYIELTLANAAGDKLYIPANDLVEYVTSGSGEGDTIIISINDNHQITATITDGSITKEKLATEVQNSLNAADSALQSESPQMSGIPTAPTAVYGTNTDQVATTAFVQQSLRPTVLISVNDIPAGTTVEVTLTLLNSESEYIVSDTLDSSGLASFLLDWAGEYEVHFSSPQVKGHHSINVSVPRIYTYSADWTESVTYTVLIDTANSNTETACTYADGALGMIKGSSEWDKQPIFKHIKPCVFQNGQVNYYLNPNDWTKKNGSDEAADLTGTDGDVMIEFPKFAYKIKTENGIITVSVSNDEAVIANDSDYTYDAFSRLEEGDLNYFYKGAFKGSLDGDGKLRSVAGTKPANNKNIGAFRAAAQLNGAHYQQSTYAQLKALQCLYLIKYGDRNGQAAVGKGVVNASASYVSGYNTPNLEDIETSTNTFNSGMTFGTTTNGTTHMRLFGIEDFWGCIWEWVDGLTTDGSRNIITSWNSFSNEGIESTTVSTPSGLTANANGWNKTVAGNSAAGFMPIEFGGSSSTYWADLGALYTSCVLYFGGGWNGGVDAGPFCLGACRGASDAAAYFGARLAYV